MSISQNKTKNNKIKSLKKNININSKDKNLNTIPYRLDLIRNITDGMIEITNLKIKYPLKLKFIPNQLPVLKSINSPYNLLSWFNKERDIQLLTSNIGSYGIPYKLCFNNCLIKNNYKIGLKIIVIEKESQEIELIEKKYKNFFINFFNDTESLDFDNPEEIVRKNISLSINVELQMIYLLKTFVVKNQTPHINLPI